MSAIDDVKQKTDIAEVIGQYAALKKAGRNLTALCPFHSEKHPSFFVYPEQQSWHCFGACNTGGDVFAFVMKKEGLDFSEALHLLARRAGITLPSRVAREEGKEEKEKFYLVNETAAVYFQNLLLNSPAAARARAYVEKRGFSARTVADFQLGFSPDSWESLKNYLQEKGQDEKTALAAGLLVAAENGRTYDRFRGKLMFPIRDVRGRVAGFGARVLDDSLPKYVNSPQSPVFDKSGTLYGIDRAAAEIRKQDRAIIMEGYMDVITAHQNGVTNAVASMGTAITETQVNMLKKLTRHLVLAMDADAAGEEAMLRTVGHENTLNSEIRVVVMPEGKDPDDIIRENIVAWQKLVDAAVPLLDFVFARTTPELDLTAAGGKSLAVERLLPVVSGVNDPVRQMHYLQKLAGLVRVDLNTIKASLSRLKPSPARRGISAKKPDRSVFPAFTGRLKDAREEYLLALLLNNPGLKTQGEDLSAYLENSENREIYFTWRDCDDPALLREKLDPAIHDHLEAILRRTLPAGRNDIQQRYEDCVMELEKRHLKNFEARRAEILAMEAASGGAGADVARLEQEGIEPSTRLRDLEARKGQKRKPAPAVRTRR
ncbi:MAG: DNA primase [Chloroflexi bacterium RBG_16_56_11]|nr:MAG: DNA primase [Chloroflexi bacterium RBG_16_56_11]